MKTTQRTFSLRSLLVFAAALTLMLCTTAQARGYSWDGERQTGLVMYSEDIDLSDFVRGLKDGSGNIVVPAQYDWINYAGPGRLIVSPHDSSNDRWYSTYQSSYGIIDYSGNVLYPIAKQYITYCEDINMFLVKKDGLITLLNKDFQEYEHFPYQSVSYLGNGFFRCEDGGEESLRDIYYNFTQRGVYKIGKGFIIPVGEHGIGFVGDISASQTSEECLYKIGTNETLWDVYTMDGVRIASGLSHVGRTQDGYFIAARLKRPEYKADYSIFDDDDKVDETTGERVNGYGLLDYSGNEILPLIYDTVYFTDDGVCFGMWTGEMEKRYYSYTISGSSTPWYYAFVYETKELTFDELERYQPKLVDVPEDAWFANAVQWAADKTMIDGTARRLYPDDNAPRGEVIEYMWKAAGRPTPTISNPFTDVSASDSYYNAVLWAYQQGITTGTSAVTFAPAETCTRAQVVTFLWRAMKGAEAEAESEFADVGADAYYASPVAWAVGKSITNGTSATTFSPDATCTRAQILTFLYRAYK